MNEIFMALAGLLSAFLVYLINKATNSLKAKTSNEVEVKYIDLLSSTIKEAVVSTNQTYTNSLKRQGEFTLDAQKEAFKMTYDKVMTILSQDAVKVLSTIYGDLDLYITSKIESEVLHENQVQ